MKRFRLLIVHREPSIREMAASMLRATGHTLGDAADEPAATRAIARDDPDLVLVGVEAARPDALAFLAQLRTEHPALPVLLLFDEAHPERTREALRRGAASVLRFPAPATQLRAAVELALESRSPRAARVVPEARPAPWPARSVGQGEPALVPTGGAWRHVIPSFHLPTAPAPSGGLFGTGEAGLIGEDPSLRQAIDLSQIIAPAGVPVLIVGEAGTGKTSLARLIHAQSHRNCGPFVKVACGTLDPERAGAELFGVAPGADPSGRPGKLAQAEGGTLLVEDFGELPNPVQVELLNALRDGAYRPEGGHRVQRVDARLVASVRETPASASSEVRSGRARLDRLCLVTLTLPPLRDRGNDIDRLADHFLKRYGGDGIGFTLEARTALRRHGWEGNLAELQAVIQQALASRLGVRITPADLALDAPTPDLSAPSRGGATNVRPSPLAGIIPLKEALEAPEKQIIVRALQALNWNRQDTARVLDIDRTTLYKKMKKYGLLFEELTVSQ